MSEQIIRFTISLPEPLLNELDNKIETQGYVSRSEFIRDLIREKMVKDEWEGGYDEVIGILSIVYTHHQNDLVQKITDIQHDANLTIMCTTHVHVNHENCLETIMLKGMADDIVGFSQKIAGLKGVKFAKLVKAAVPIS
ncbi:MAG: nickel-responsive transcriptional regulator NikR [Campylobacteraceae bacterium]|jgi:CopG family nickel-responsive transcriptional regulator|nr:nickel-responsive transcriptional regulator NikR [Campylobacteraceae bacterium]